MAPCDGDEKYKQQGKRKELFFLPLTKKKRKEKEQKTSLKARAHGGTAIKK